MSVINAIFQAIIKAIAWSLPISESGHSAVLNDFSGRADGSVYALSGVIHIGIAIGIVLAMYRLFITLTKQLIGCATDIANKQFSYKSAKPSRRFMLMTLVSFVPMLLWLIPIGKNGFLFSVLHMPAYNQTLLDEGIFIAVTGGLIFLASRQLSRSRNNKQVTLPMALIIGAASLFLIPVSGMSLIGGVFAILMLLGVSKKLALRYGFAMSVPVLIVMGILEICLSDFKASAVEVIIGLLLSVIFSFAFVKVFKWLIGSAKLKYVAYYDFAVGAIIAIVGIVQLIVR